MSTLKQPVVTSLYSNCGLTHWKFCVTFELRLTVFWLHSNQNPSSSQLADTLTSFPGIDNACLDMSDNPYVITPQTLASFFPPENDKFVIDTLGACAQFFNGFYPFSTHAVFSYFTHCHSFHASSFTLFHFTSLSPSNSCYSLSLCGLSHVPPLYFTAAPLNVCGWKPAAGRCERIICIP